MNDLLGGLFRIVQSIWNQREECENPCTNNAYFLSMKSEDFGKIFTIIKVSCYPDLAVFNIPGRGMYVTTVLDLLNCHNVDNETLLPVFMQTIGFSYVDSIEHAIEVLDPPLLYYPKSKNGSTDPIEVKYLPGDLELPLIESGNHLIIDSTIDLEAISETICRLETWLVMRGMIYPKISHQQNKFSVLRLQTY